MIAAEKADCAAVCTPPDTSEIIEPDRDLAAAFEERYERYRALFAAARGFA